MALCTSSLEAETPLWSYLIVKFNDANDELHENRGKFGTLAHKKKC
jgi:hypothetical protein